MIANANNLPLNYLCITFKIYYFLILYDLIRLLYYFIRVLYYFSYVLFYYIIIIRELELVCLSFGSRGRIALLRSAGNSG